MARSLLVVFVCLVPIVAALAQPPASPQTPTFPQLPPPTKDELPLIPNLPGPIGPLGQPKGISPIPIPVPPPPRPLSSLAFRLPSGQIKYNFVFDEKMPLKDLLPTSPHKKLRAPMLFNEDLTKVPEVLFGEPISKTLHREEAMERTAHIVAKINHLNAKKRDAFVEALIDNRDDLRGLAFSMGDACRTSAEHAKALSEVSEVIQTELRTLRDASQLEQPLVDAFWKRMHERFVGPSPEAKVRVQRCGQAALDRALVAALMQILAPESEACRVGLARFLGTINHLDAIQALARVALFAPEESVRSVAVEGLRLRRERDYTPILMEGFRYPLPAVSKRAAEALIKLERKDLLGELIGVLEQPDPSPRVDRARW